MEAKSLKFDLDSISMFYKNTEQTRLMFIGISTCLFGQRFQPHGQNLEELVLTVTHPYSIYIERKFQHSFRQHVKESGYRIEQSQDDQFITLKKMSISATIVKNAFEKLKNQGLNRFKVIAHGMKITDSSVIQKYFHRIYKDSKNRMDIGCEITLQREQFQIWQVPLEGQFKRFTNIAIFPIFGRENGTIRCQYLSKKVKIYNTWIHFIKTSSTMTEKTNLTIAGMKKRIEKLEELLIQFVKFGPSCRMRLEVTQPISQSTSFQTIVNSLNTSIVPDFFQFNKQYGRKLNVNYVALQIASWLDFYKQRLNRDANLKINLSMQWGYLFLLNLFGYNAGKFYSSISQQWLIDSRSLNFELSQSLTYAFQSIKQSRSLIQLIKEAKTYSHSLQKIIMETMQEKKAKQLLERKQLINESNRLPTRIIDSMKQQAQIQEYEYRIIQSEEARLALLKIKQKYKQWHQKLKNDKYPTILGLKDIRKLRKSLEILKKKRSQTSKSKGRQMRNAKTPKEPKEPKEPFIVSQTPQKTKQIKKIPKNTSKAIQQDESERIQEMDEQISHQIPQIAGKRGRGRPKKDQNAKHRGFLKKK